MLSNISIQAQSIHIKEKYDVFIPIPHEKFIVAKTDSNNQRNYGVVDIEDRVFIPLEYDYINVIIDRESLFIKKDTIYYLMGNFSERVKEYDRFIPNGDEIFLVYKGREIYLINDNNKRIVITVVPTEYELLDYQRSAKESLPHLTREND